MTVGEKDANSVKERIKHWQAQGGGVIVADEPGACVESLEVKDHVKISMREDRSRTPSSRHRKGVGRSDASKEQSPADNVGESQSRPGWSTPTKRVLSDSHWRKKRTPSKETSHSKGTSNEDYEKVGVTEVRMSSAAKEGRRTSVRSTPDRHEEAAYPNLQNSIRNLDSQKRKDYPRRKESGEHVDETGEGQGIEPRSLKMKKHSPSRQNRKVSLQSQQEAYAEDTNDVGRRRSRLQRKEYNGNSNEMAREAFSESRGSTYSKKGNILTQLLGESRKMFASPLSEPQMEPRIPTIEQWLDETPDPFVDAGDVPVEVVPPLRPSHRKRKVTPEETITKSQQRTPSTSGRQASTETIAAGRRRSKRASQIEEIERQSSPAESNKVSSTPRELPRTLRKIEVNMGEQETAQTPTSVLSRRGANRRASSPVKDRRRSQILETHEEGAEDPSAIPSSRPHSPIGSLRNQQQSPLKPPGLNIRKPFPSLGERRLSTIASMSTFHNESLEKEAPSGLHVPKQCENPVTESRKVDPGDKPQRVASKSLRRRESRLTKHSDLMSVLSLPQGGGRSIRSARSVRTTRSRLDSATVPDLMRELQSDEEKFMRELHTLVDGVIPVLLTCVLSKADSAVAAGLFRSSANKNEDPTFTKPIVDMGICLERLRTLHKRMPHNDPRALLTWAHGAQRVYSEYLKAWRLGFQDVIVNLAPATGPSSVEQSKPQGQKAEDQTGFPRNADGDVTNGDGERVDVAFLLKRPLVRLKYLAKTLKGIDFIQHTTETQMLATRYQNLVEDAKQRNNEERSRLEDESAANLDATRVRDPQTLAPVTGVVIDRARRVRARDHFNLTLNHSNGQQIDCRTELLLRDDPSGQTGSGDLLICEVDETDRWLLLPPVRSDLISARNGDLRGEIVVMIRGGVGSGNEWQELISLMSEEEDVGFEWVQMLGLDPVPPQIARSRSFVNQHRGRQTSLSLREEEDNENEGKARPETIISNTIPRMQDVEVPIGEQPNETTRLWDRSRDHQDEDVIRAVKAQIESSDLSHAESPSTPSRKISKKDGGQANDLHLLPSQKRDPKPRAPEFLQTPRSFKEALGLSGTSSTVGLKRTRAKRLSKYADTSPRSRGSRAESVSDASSPATGGIHVQRTQNGSPSKLKSHDRSIIGKPAGENEVGLVDSATDTLPTTLPSKELPPIPKSRRSTSSAPNLPSKDTEPNRSTPPQPSPSDSSRSKRRQTISLKNEINADNSVNSPSEHVSLNADQQNPSNTPVLEKVSIKPRRSSSPLKHEYAPSAASDTSSDSDTSTVAHNDTSPTSESSDEELEEGDAPTPLIPIGVLRKLHNPVSRRGLHPPTEGSVKPSDSASQAPYKTVPSQPTKSSRTIASIYSWSDLGAWESLHPDECSIVITPGLIEAFEMSAAHSHAKPLSSSVPVTDLERFSDLASEATSQNDDVGGERPLVALELTPLVPLRRGTAIDISIRSPPTSNSQITSGNNIMFRSRSPEECEALYSLINHSRIHNPTFIALQNARGPYGGGSSFAGPVGRGTRSQTSNNQSSWFSGWGRSTSYRASTKRASSVAQTESSIASMSSAFSALKRFSNRSGGGLFNIAKSTIGARTGSGANSIYTSSDNSSGTGTTSPAPVSADTHKEAPIGLSNAKIRLYVRESASRWRDMGSARMTIMRPDRHLVGPDGRPLSSHGAPVIHEKRIVINGKTKGEVLLDEQLGESCFERIARTGIAVSVWEDVLGPNGEVGVVNAVGGVAGGRATVYMIQVCLTMLG